MPLKGWSARRLISRLNSGGGSMTGLPSERSYTFSGPNCFFMAMPSSNIRLIHDPTTMPFLTLSDTDTFDFLSAQLKCFQVDFKDILRHAPGDAVFPDFNIQRREHGKTAQHVDIKSPYVTQFFSSFIAVDEIDLVGATFQSGGNLVVGGGFFLSPADRSEGHTSALPSQLPT